MVDEIIIKFPVIENEILWENVNNSIVGTIAFKCRECKSYGYPNKTLTF